MHQILSLTLIKIHFPFGFQWTFRGITLQMGLAGPLRIICVCVVRPYKKSENLVRTASSFRISHSLYANNVIHRSHSISRSALLIEISICVQVKFSLRRNTKINIEMKLKIGRLFVCVCVLLTQVFNQSKRRIDERRMGMILASTFSDKHRLESSDSSEKKYFPI